MTADEIRALFPGTRKLIYFNAAAQALMPEPVARRIADVARGHSERGITAHRENMDAVDSARARAARLIGCEPHSIALMPNTAEGVGRVAAGLHWTTGDEVVLADLEFPANVYPWAAQRRHGVRLRFVPSEDGRVDVQRYLDALGPRTRVLAVSHVQFSTGYRVELEPLGRACRERGILFFVDAIQSLGVVPLDVRRLGIGALAVDGRKWLMGPPGGGFLYVAPEWLDRVRPPLAGAWSVRNPEDLMQYRGWIDGEGQLDLDLRLAEGARRMEAGFPNVIGAAGLDAALELGETIGRERVHGHIAELVRRFVEGLSAAGLPVRGPRHAGERAGIVSFEVPVRATDLFRELVRRGFSISVRDGLLRVSPHVYNTADEVDRLLELLPRLL
jgi:selenocysteine lyase/cysteine desulfurase